MSFLKTERDLKQRRVNNQRNGGENLENGRFNKDD